ncbi:MAG TPA: DUF1343 domain-containing protein [Gemmatimonadales bacterium]|nr:DUF1343 domain-containing protein [Gemmatimonadales bacterium]
MRPHHLSLLGLLVCAPRAAAQVRPGVEVLLADSSHLVRGRRVGLLTNQTGVDRAGRRTIDLLAGAPGVRLVLLLSPEHGIRGVEDRPGLPDAVDSATGLPIYSLYGGTPLAAIAALDSVDVLLVDLQDIGARYYSYPATTVLLMQEAVRRGKRIVVLDRPNPIGGIAVEGNVPARPGPIRGPADFLAVPMRHGMTLGELMRMANAVYAIQARLTVVPARGWRRSQFYDATGLPWVRPSPNMPDLESALDYPGTCLFEATNLSVGRGTDMTFQVLGAPWLDTAGVLGALRRAPPAGVALSGVAFTPRAPTDAKYDGVLLAGLRLRVTDRRRYDPTRTALALLVAIHAVGRDSLRFNGARFDQLAAGPELREAIAAGRSAAAIARGWPRALTRFRQARAAYLLY